MYLYGRTFIMETDHKPLKMISLKNLTVAPACLQRMLLHLQQYDLVIMYWPGREMLLADALSCLPSRTNTEIKLDLWIDVCLHPKTSDQDWCRDTGPHPLDSAQTHPEWLAQQTRSCPQSSKILLELPWWTLYQWRHPYQGWMSGHLTILQRQYHGWPPWKPCRNQQGNGPGQDVCLLAGHASRCDQLH